MKIRRFRELKNLESFEERYNYLRLTGVVGKETFGFDRYLNQMLYNSQLWLSVRDAVILRDNGCDLGIEDRMITSRIIVHHMNPISVQDILERKKEIVDPEYLICVSHSTHLAIHFSDEKLLVGNPVIRKPGDTTPWFSQNGRS